MVRAGGRLIYIYIYLTKSFLVSHDVPWDRPTVKNEIKRTANDDMATREIKWVRVTWSRIAFCGPAFGRPLNIKILFLSKQYYVNHNVRIVKYTSMFIIWVKRRKLIFGFFVFVIISNIIAITK